MTNIVDFSKVAKQRVLETKIAALLDAGLNSKDITMVTCACSRAFSQTIPKLQDIGMLGMDKLNHIGVAVTEEETYNRYSFGPKDKSVLDYIVGHGILQMEWEGIGGTGFNLTNDEDPGQTVVNACLKLLSQMDMDAVGLYGFFALDTIYFSCHRGLRPLHFHVDPVNHQVTLMALDPERDCTVLLIASLEKWAPTEEDLKVPPSEMSDT